MKLAADWILLSALLVSVSSGPLCAADDAARAGQADVAFWESVRDSKDPSELEAYLKAFPQGKFAPLATIRLNKLKGAAGDRKADTPPAAPTPMETTRAATQVDIPRAPPAKVRGWIGAEVRSINEQRARELGLATASGAEVVSLVSFGPAASNGLKPNDVVLSIDGEPLVDHAHLIRLISAIAPTRTTELAILRGGQRQTVKLAVGNYFEDQWTAAHRNDPLGMVNLGNLYADGGLVDRNVPEARKWLERAANGGSALAMRAIAERYEMGRGFEQNDGEAYRWYERAVAAGDAQSMFALGLFYRRGRAVELDLRKAAELNERAAALGHPGATQNYGLALFDGEGGVEKNEARAIEYFRRAAKLGRPEAFMAIAQAYYAGRGVTKNLPEALNWYREAVRHGNRYAYSGIAMMYERGEGGLAKNRAEAIKNYRMAAEANDPEALARLKALKATPHDPAEVQKLLAALGFDPGPRPGPKTADAIRKFQQSRGLPVDGKASLSLVGKLREAMKQKTAAAKTNAEGQTTGAEPIPPLDGLRNLEKLD